MAMRKIPSVSDVVKATTNAAIAKADEEKKRVQAAAANPLNNQEDARRMANARAFENSQLNAGRINSGITSNEGKKKKNEIASRMLLGDSSPALKLQNAAANLATQKYVNDALTDINNQIHQYNASAPAKYQMPEWGFGELANAMGKPEATSAYELMTGMQLPTDRELTAQRQTWGAGMGAIEQLRQHNADVSKWQRENAQYNEDVSGGYDTVIPTVNGYDQRTSGRLVNSAISGAAKGVANMGYLINDMGKNSGTMYLDEAVRRGALAKDVADKVKMDYAALVASGQDKALADSINQFADQLQEQADYGANSVQKFINAIGNSAGGMALDAAANMVLPGSGLASMGLRSFGGGLREADESGAEGWKKYLYAAGVGGVEMLTEKIGGAASVLTKTYGKSIANATINKLARELPMTPKGQAVLNFLGNAASEGAEEMLADVLDYYIEKATINPDAELSLTDVLYDGLVGAAFGGVLGAGDVVADKIGAKGRTGAEILNAALNDRNSVSQEEINQIVKSAAKGEEVKDVNKFFDEMVEDYKTWTSSNSDAVRRIADQMGGVSEAAKDLMQNSFSDSNLSAAEFVPAFMDYYNAGVAGEKFSRVKNKGGIADDLAMAVYAEGEKAASLGTAEKLGQADTGVDTSHLTNKLSDTELAKYNQMASMTASKIILRDDIIKNGKRINGRVTADGVIELNVRSPKAMNFVVGHEITHRLEKLAPEEYKKFRNFVLRKMGNTSNNIFGKVNQYAEIGDNLTNEGAMGEIVADFAGRLMDETDLINSLVAEDRNLAQKIYDAIRSMLRHFSNDNQEALEGTNMSKADLEKAAELWKKALAAADGKAETKNSTENKSVQYHYDGVVLSRDNKENARKMPLLASEKVIRDYINYAVEYGNSNGDIKKQFSVLRLLDVNPEVADYLGDLLGVDVSEAKHAIRDNDIRHMLKSPGVTSMDIENIPDILENWDLVFRGNKTADGNNTIYYVQRHNGTTYYVEDIVADEEIGEMILGPKQMKKVPTGTIPKFIEKLKLPQSDVAKIIKKIKEISVSQRTDVPEKSVPGEHVQDAEGNKEISLTNNIIADNAEESNTKWQNSYGGVKAKGADMNALDAAMRMEREGASASEIKKETGWHRGADKQWRFEIDDSEIYYYGKAGGKTLRSLIKHDELFENYPELGGVRVDFRDLESDENGHVEYAYNGEGFEPIIAIDNKFKDSPEGIIMHEVQHIIQRIEGFARGSSPEFWAKKVAEGYDARDPEDVARHNKAFADLQQAMAKYPELVREYMELMNTVPNIPRGKVDWDTLEQIEDDPVEWQEFDTKRDSLEEKWGSDLYFEIADIVDDYNSTKSPKARTPFDLYYNTAGEIEARDTAYRLNLSKEERANKMPFTGFEGKTVFGEFADSGNERYSYTPTNKITKDTEDKALVQALSDIVGASGFDNAADIKKAITDLRDEYLDKGDVAAENIDNLTNLVVKNGLAKNDDAGVDADILKTMRKTPIKLTDEEKAAFGGKEEWKKIRNRSFGNLRISNKGIPIGKAYQELSSMDAALFPEDITDGAAQLRQMLNVVQMGKDAYNEVQKIYEKQEGWDEYVKENVTNAIQDYIVSLEKAMAPTVLETLNSGKRAFEGWRFYITRGKNNNDVTISLTAPDNERYTMRVEKGKFKSSTELNMMAADFYEETVAERAAAEEYIPESPEEDTNWDDIPAETINGSDVEEPTITTEEEIQRTYKQKILPLQKQIKDLNKEANLNDQERFILDGLTNFDEDGRPLVTENQVTGPKKQIILKIAALKNQIRSHVNDMAAVERRQQYKEIVAPIKDIAMNFKNIKHKQMGTFDRNIKSLTAGLDAAARKVFDNVLMKPWREAKKSYIDSYESALKDFRKSIQEDLGIVQGSKESAAIMWIGEHQRQVDNDSKNKSDKAQNATNENRDTNTEEKLIETEEYTLDMLKAEFNYKMENGKYAWENILEAEKWFRAKYDSYVERINETLRVAYPNPYDANGELIPGRRLIKRDDYFHHFSEQQSAMAEAMAFLQSGNNAMDIDPALVGQSEFTKPKTKWTGFLQHRGVGAYTEDAVGGMLKYMQQAEYKIAMEPMIPRLRAIVAALREAGQENGAPVRAINSAIEYFDDFANMLAGKSTFWDRAAIKMLGGEGVGRERLLKVNKIGGRVRSNAVLGNINSMFAQVLNLPNVVSKIKTPHLLAAAADLYSTTSPDSMVNELMSQSTFLRERFLGREERAFKVEGAVKNGMKNLQDAAAFGMEIGDEMVTKLCWLGAYRQVIKEGITDGDKTAVEIADEITRSAVGGRGIGEVPLGLQSKTANFFIPFQIEVANTLAVYKEVFKGNKNFLRIMVDLGKLLGLTWLLNELLEKLTGRRPLADPVDVIVEAVQNYKPGDSLQALVVNTFTRELGEVISMIPGGAQVAGLVWTDDDAERLFGESDPTRFGTGNLALGTAGSFVKGTVGALKGEDVNLVDVGFDAAQYVLPWGSKQLERFAQTAQYYGVLPNVTVSTDGVNVDRQKAAGAYANDGTLKFALDTTPGDILQTMAFGVYATGNGQRYINDLQRLNKEGTNAYNQLAGTDSVSNKELEDIIRNAIGIERAKAEKVKVAPYKDGYDPAMETMKNLLPKGYEYTKDSMAAEYISNTKLSTSEQITVWRNVNLNDTEKDWLRTLENGGYGTVPEAADLVANLQEASKAADKLNVLRASNMSMDDQARFWSYYLASDDQKKTVNTMMGYKMTEADAYELLTSGYKITKELGDSLPDAVAAGIDAKEYVVMQATASSFKSMQDGRGKTINGSKQRKVIAYIDSLDLNPDQKDILYAASGYTSASALKKRPWRGATNVVLSKAEKASMDSDIIKDKEVEVEYKHYFTDGEDKSAAPSKDAENASSGSDKTGLSSVAVSNTGNGGNGGGTSSKSSRSKKSVKSKKTSLNYVRLRNIASILSGGKSGSGYDRLRQIAQLLLK